MLISTQTKVKHAVQITLKYDDGSTVEHNLVVGMKVDITYYKNGRIGNGVGTIKEFRFPTKYAYNLGTEYESLVQRAPVSVDNRDANFPDSRRNPVPSPQVGGHITSGQVNPWYEKPSPQVFLVIDFSKEFESSLEEVADINILTLKQVATSAISAELFNLYEVTKATVKNDEGQYTTESYDALVSVMETVKTSILENPNAGSVLISAGISILNKAITELVSSDGSTINPDDEDGHTCELYTDEEIKTGVNNVLKSDS